MVLLPLDFQPSPYSVVFGRGKTCTESVGNRRLKVIASMFLARYSRASTRDEKSLIVSEIQGIIRAACPNGGAFVRRERVVCEKNGNGQSSCWRWLEVEENDIREKIGRVLRDWLHTKYRSSVKFKCAVRRNRRLAASKNSIAVGRPAKRCDSPSSFLEDSNLILDLMRAELIESTSGFSFHD